MASTCCTVPQISTLVISKPRVRRGPSGLEYLEPVEVHGDPVCADGAIVTFDWGQDLPGAGRDRVRHVHLGVPPWRADSWDCSAISGGLRVASRTRQTPSKTFDVGASWPPRSWTDFAPHCPSARGQWPTCSARGPGASRGHFGRWSRDPAMRRSLHPKSVVRTRLVCSPRHGRRHRHRRPHGQPRWSAVPAKTDRFDTEPVTPAGGAAIVDDASTDGSSGLIRDIASVIADPDRTHDRRGSRYTDLRAASRPRSCMDCCWPCHFQFVMLADHDDEWLPDRLIVNAISLVPRPERPARRGRRDPDGQIRGGNRRQSARPVPATRGLGRVGPAERVRAVIRRRSLQGLRAHCDGS